LHNESESVPLRSFPEVRFITGQDRPDILFLFLFFFFVTLVAIVTLFLSTGVASLLLDEVPLSSDSLRRGRSLGSGAAQQQQGS
jgi:hypothetical protein